jgi:hypothetical protein
MPDEKNQMPDENEEFEDDTDNANALVNDITDAHILALDQMGWKLVCIYDDRKWPFGSKFGCPDWCESL